MENFVKDWVCLERKWPWQDIVEYWVLTKHIEVVLRSGNFEKGLANPSDERSNGLQNYTFFALHIPEILVPSSWVILTLSVPAVDAFNHA